MPDGHENVLDLDQDIRRVSARLPLPRDLAKRFGQEI
jgi:hypothetical protein